MSPLSSWLANTVYKHDQIHGANLTVPCSNAGALQLIKLHTHRSSQDTHHKWERPCSGIEREHLTSSLRGIFILRAFRFVLRPPASRAGSPRLALEVLEWKV
ncbi:hypothetical protein Q5752_000698 [Cryptotrichosporon argae]